MTSEDIEQDADRLLEEYGHDLPVSALADFARSLVSRAYEEAAEWAEHHGQHCANDDPEGCPDAIADEIRARAASSGTGTSTSRRE